LLPHQHCPLHHHLNISTDGGDCIANYGISTKLWKEHSATDEFATAFTAIIDDATLTNDDRAAKVEDFLLTHATLVGVVDVSYTHR
jgi:hypothetical protein